MLKQRKWPVKVTPLSELTDEEVDREYADIIKKIQSDTEHPELEPEEDTRTEEEREDDEQQEYEEFMASVLTEPPFDVSAGKVSIDRRG